MPSDFHDHNSVKMSLFGRFKAQSRVESVIKEDLTKSAGESEMMAHPESTHHASVKTRLTSSK